LQIPPAPIIFQIAPRYLQITTSNLDHDQYSWSDYLQIYPFYLQMDPCLGMPSPSTAGSQPPLLPPCSPLSPYPSTSAPLGRGG
jgi:hypothetical protein